MTLVAIAPSSLDKLFAGLRRAVDPATEHHDERGERRSNPLDPTSPAIDLLDEGDAFVLLADIPGFERGDVSVSVDDGVLCVTADSSPSTQRRGTYLRQERQGSRMTREVPLPAPVDEATLTTRYRRGVLLVRLPKADPDCP